MADQHTSLLVDTPLVRIFDVACHEPRSGYGPTMCNRAPLIGLQRRGVFVMEQRGRPFVVDTTTAVLMGADDEYRVLHPVDGGDDATVIDLDPAVLEDAVGDLRGRAARLEPRDHFAVCLLTRSLRAAHVEPVEAEDASLLLLSSLASAFGRDPGYRLGAHQRRRVEQARLLLAAAPAKRWDLASLGQALACSPFHLARQFKLATGETISRYLLRLRLAAAVDRLAGGEQNLATLAHETGFSHQSHLTARFRTAFGLTPARARELLSRS